MVIGRSSCSSEVVILHESMRDAVNREQPTIANIAVTQSSRVHVGPQFVSIKQNVDKRKVLKDMPFHRYILHYVKNTTRAERLFCSAAIVALLICILLIVYFTVITKNREKEDLDVAPHTWYINKEMWLAVLRNYTEKTNDFDPLKLVIVAHTVSTECHNFADCAAEMRSMQSYFLSSYGYDIPYNFLIGNDGRVYEGRGFNIVGAHTYGYNRCSLGLAFVGDYREGLPSYSKVTRLQQERAHLLFGKAVELGYLDSQFDVLGAMDLQSSLSPGTNLYKAIQKWPHYGNDTVYKNRTCKEIYFM